MSKLLLFYSPSLSEENGGSCNGTTHLHNYLTIYESSPFNSLLYAMLEVIALYRQEHERNYAPTECIGSHVNKISTPLIVLVHSYRTEIRMGINWPNKSSLSKRTNGGGSLRLAK